MDNHPQRLLLVRHGETDWNRQLISQGHIDVPLNETGRRQAEALAERVRSWKIDALYSSDLQRAAETAGILGAALGLVARLETGWREIDVGSWGGLTSTAIQERFPDELEALARGEDVPRGGGESRAMLQARVVAEYERLGAVHAGETVMVVSHGGALKVLIAHLIGLELRYLDRISTRGNTGLSVVEFASGRPRLILLNDTSHLDGAAPRSSDQPRQMTEKEMPGDDGTVVERPCHP